MFNRSRNQSRQRLRPCVRLPGLWKMTSEQVRTIAAKQKNAKKTSFCFIHLGYLPVPLGKRHIFFRDKKVSWHVSHLSSVQTLTKRVKKCQKGATAKCQSWQGGFQGEMGTAFVFMKWIRITTTSVCICIELYHIVLNWRIALESTWMS